MEEEKIKEAFLKVKKDMDSLNNEISQIKSEIHQIYGFLSEIPSSTIRQINPTHPATSTDNPTHPQEIGGLKHPNLGISIGNEGASTDRQTDRQTDNPTHLLSGIPEIPYEIPSKSIEKNIFEATKILNSLDTIKKQIRLKFKHLTSQEMLVFSTIYQLEEQNIQPDYKQIAQKLKLSESSIRDYIQRIINKGIPIIKHKINNKKLVLSISPELKNIASLSTIIKLREI